LRYAY